MKLVVIKFNEVMSKFSKEMMAKLLAKKVLCKINGKKNFGFTLLKYQRSLSKRSKRSVRKSRTSL